MTCNKNMDTITNGILNGGRNLEQRNWTFRISPFSCLKKPFIKLFLYEAVDNKMRNRGFIIAKPKTEDFRTTCLIFKRFNLATLG